MLCAYDERYNRVLALHVSMMYPCTRIEEGRGTRHRTMGGYERLWEYTGTGKNVDEASSRRGSVLSRRRVADIICGGLTFALILFSVW